MKTNSPTHDEVAHLAQEIWEARGRPSGHDTEIWLEAERKLSATASAQNSPSDPHGRGNGNSQSDEGGRYARATVATPETAVPASSPGETTAKAAQQKKAARAPKLPGKTAPKGTPPESGKPLWDKPHSS